MMFDRSKLKIRPLGERVHDLDAGAVRPLGAASFHHRSIDEIALRIAAARASGREVIMFAGGHVVRAGVQNYLIDLLRKGYITCIAMNGSVMVHDFELALIGATTESVARYVRDGRFGLWEETGRINDIVNAAYHGGDKGMGRAVGKAIQEGEYSRKDISILAACYRLDIRATVHIGIGYDIIHEHPNFDGAAAGGMSYRDFLVLAGAIENLEGGVVMNFGSAVMAPEVYLKALSMARNAASSEGREIRHFATLVCDLYPLPEDFHREPAKDDPSYYFRPWKTMLVRTVADGGESFYVRGNHADTVPALWTAIRELER
ncbi:MAG: hypothetical protein M0Z71_02810 [Nitrospiraceae bacterium]|nr:hypothetical protein [Nitrospiraceae bacterium]